MQLESFLGYTQTEKQQQERQLQSFLCYTQKGYWFMTSTRRQVEKIGEIADGCETLKGGGEGEWKLAYADIHIDKNNTHVYLLYGSFPLFELLKTSKRASKLTCESVGGISLLFCNYVNKK